MGTMAITLLLHGALGNSAQMHPLAAALTDDVRCPELPGHGQSSSDDRPYRVEDFSATLAEQIQAPVHLIGYSLGGYMALHLAAARPDLVQSVTTIATKFDWSPETAEREVRMLDPDRVEEKVPAFAKMLEQRHGVHWKQVMLRTASLMRSLGSAPVLTAALLQKVRCPVLLLRGSDDSMVSEAETLWAKGAIATAVHRELPDQPHPIERMDVHLIAGLIGSVGRFTDGRTIR